MGFPFLDEVATRIQNALMELHQQAEKVATWPEPLHEELSNETERIAGELEELVRQLRARPRGEELGPQPDLAPYAVESALPFRSGLVRVVVPGSYPWKVERQTWNRLFDRAEVGDRLDVVAYLDTEDQRLIDGALDALENLADVMGYGELEIVEEQRGSIFRRSWGGLKRGLGSDEFKSRAQQVERALQLAGIASKQAEVDEATARAVESLLASTTDIPRVCMRAGSILLVKYQDPVSGAVVFVRTLSAIEMATLEKFPGIQREPETVLQMLAQMIAQHDAIEE